MAWPESDQRYFDSFPGSIRNDRVWRRITFSCQSRLCSYRHALALIQNIGGLVLHVDLRFCRKLFRRIESPDPMRVADHLAKGGTYFDIPSQQLLARDELVSHLRDYFRRDNHCYTLVGEVLAAEQSIAFQYRASPFLWSD